MDTLLELELEIELVYLEVRIQSFSVKRDDHLAANSFAAAINSIEDMDIYIYIYICMYDFILILILANAILN